MLARLLSKTGQAIWLLLGCITMFWIGYAGAVGHHGPLGWLEAAGYLNKLTAALVFAGAVVVCWPFALLYDVIAHQGRFVKRTETECDAEEATNEHRR
jgi:hypothetical protein